MTEDQIERVVAMRLSGAKLAEIARVLGVKYHAVEYVCEKRSLINRGSKKTTPLELVDAVLERRRRSPPVPHKLIARELSITYSMSEHIWLRYGRPRPESPAVAVEREKLRAYIAAHLEQVRENPPPPFKPGILVWDQRPNYGFREGAD